MRDNYPRIMRAVMESPWAILPHKLEAIVDLVSLYAGGGELAAETIQAATRARPASRVSGNVAILPLFGSIFPRGNLMTEMSGATSVEAFAGRFRELLNNPEVGAIVLDVDSPGGAVSGIAELATEIYAARGQKPIIAVANHQAASAAYWLATAADELVVTPSGEVGSIGVFAAHQDVSGALEREGIKVKLISAGKYKVEGNPYEPLAEEAQAAIQSRVDEYYEMFVRAVARHRGVTPSDVRNGFGEGRMVGARQAVALGMADRVGTLEETVERLMKGRGRKRSPKADLDFRQRRARLASKLGTHGSDEPISCRSDEWQ